MFGQFVRDDLKDSYGFLSTRWLTVEHLVEHVGLGLGPEGHQELGGTPRAMRLGKA